MNLTTQNNSSKTEIVICDECKGYGTTERRVWHNEYETETCGSCNGSGRLEKVVEIKYNKLKEVE